MLLGSPPDMVRRFALRETGLSAPFPTGCGTLQNRGSEFIPAVADCRLQGTAISPTSAVLPITGQDFHIISYFTFFINTIL